MNPNYLDFEQPIAELLEKIEQLQNMETSEHEDAADLAGELKGLQEELNFLTERIYSHLSAWQIARIARHPRRPHTSDYIPHIFSEFEPLYGDRQYGEDASIVGGLARLDGQSVMLIGHEKGSPDVKDKIRRNFGMPRPEGYRKALRLMQLAERFKIPLITFIDTPGAYPGIDAEERGQSQAIAQNLEVMSRLKIPVLSVVIGEGGSGGALAIGVCDQLLMLQYSTYSVISPEGCASILWKDAKYAEEAAEAMGITAERLFELGLVDHLIMEPAGGAHRNLKSTAALIKQALIEQLHALRKIPNDQLLQRRLDKLMACGRAEG